MQQLPENRGKNRKVILMGFSQRSYFQETTETVRLTPGVLSGSWRGFHRGLIRPGYFDFDLYIQDPGHIERAVDMFVSGVLWVERMTERKVDLLAFLKKNDVDNSNTVGLLPLVSSICTDELIMLPHVVVRLDRPFDDRVKVSPEINISSAFQQQRTVVLVDHVTTGNEVLDVVKTLRSREAEVTDVITFAIWKKEFYDDMNIYQQRLEKHKVNLHYFHHLEEPSDPEGVGKPDLIENEGWLQELEKLYDSVKLAGV